MGTLAWLSDNDSVDSSGMNITVDAQDHLLGVEYYNIDDTYVGGYKFNKTDSPKLGKYMLLNPKYQLLIKFYVDNSVDNVVVEAKTATTYFLGDGRHPLLAAASDANFTPATGTTEDGEQYTNVLTSIVALSAFGNSNEITVTDSGNAVTLSNLPSARSTFVETDEKDSAAGNVKNVLSLSVGTVGSTFKAQACRAFYFIVDYDGDLVARVFSQNIGNDVVADVANVKGIPFICDFSLHLK